MKIQLYSDLHIEFGDFEASIDQADVVVFAGDIEIGVKGVQWMQTLDSDKPMIYVLGNHEYYKNTYPRLVDKIKAQITKPNIYVLENDSVTIDKVTFHGCTLWTDFELFGSARIAGYECQQVMTDFKKIRKLPNYSKLRAIDVSAIHRRSLKWLKDSLSNSKSDTNVVVTHHAPSIQSVPEKYQDDIVSAAYASHLEGFIAETQPDLWLHGHLHNSSDYQVGGTRVVCNPWGYYMSDLNPGFELEKVVEVDSGKVNMTHAPSSYKLK